MNNPLGGTRYANVVATLALVVALGGTGYAAAKIDTNDIKANAVTSPKIKNNQVKGADVADLKMRKITLINGWEPFNGTVRVGKSPDGVIHLSGAVKLPAGPAYSQLVGVLPSGHRPKGVGAFLSTNLSGGAPARLVIGTNGQIGIQFVAPTTSTQARSFTSLDVSFVP